jgi:hypothetical protein
MKVLPLHRDEHSLGDTREDGERPDITSRRKITHVCLTSIYGTLTMVRALSPGLGWVNDK